MRTTVMANRDDDDPGVVGDRLRERGHRLRTLYREDHRGWVDSADADLFVLLGSDWSVYWPAVAAAVEAEAAVVRDAHARGVPVLGVCFGAQMVAHALGATVERAEVAEVGWYSVEASHPAIHEGPWLQWHVDRFHVPDGFDLLAASPVGPQAMLSGRTLAVQFHPEATIEMVGRWASGSGVAELARHGRTSAAVLSPDRFTASANRCRELVDWFLDMVAQESRVA